MKRPILIGYWRSKQEPSWPDPARFVDPQWEPEIRDVVIKYLDAGETLSMCMGRSWCRFRCREYGQWGLGSSTLTDGVYLWPNGLSHYLEKHAVRLPQSFVEHVLQRAKQPTRLESLLRWLAGEPGPDYDEDWWRAQTGFTEGECFLSPAVPGVAFAILPPREPDTTILSFLHRYRFVPYWRINTEEFLAEVRMGVEFTSKESLDHWRFRELADKAADIGLQLKFIEGEPR
ncbi:MAG: hypothetical protein ABIP14_17015 [Blastocatellia bacterium]